MQINILKALSSQWQKDYEEPIGEPDATSHPKKPIRPFEMINNTSKYVRTISCQPF